MATPAGVETIVTSRGLETEHDGGGCTSRGCFFIQQPSVRETIRIGQCVDTCSILVMNIHS